MRRLRLPTRWPMGLRRVGSEASCGFGGTGLLESSKAQGLIMIFVVFFEVPGVLGRVGLCYGFVGFRSGEKGLQDL